MSELTYITKQGALALQAELTRLRTTDRPKIVREVADAAAQGDRSENAEYIYGKKKLREIDRRIYFLVKRLEVVTVVEPRSEATDKIYFGARVRFADEDGKESTVRLVGEDEVNATAGDVSYKSPIGRVLLGKRAGESVVHRRPSGEIELEILEVSYLTEGSMA